MNPPPLGYILYYIEMNFCHIMKSFKKRLLNGNIFPVMFEKYIVPFALEKSVMALRKPNCLKFL